MWAVPEAAVGDADGADAHLDPQAPGPLPRLERAGADGVRAVRIVVGVAPGPEFAGDGQLTLQALVMGLQVLVGDWPVGCYSIAGVDLEVGGVKARGEAGVVDHRPTDAAAAVVLAELHRVIAADDALLGPVQRVCARLVRDPIFVRVPEGPGLQHEHTPALAGETLRERCAASARTDDQHVDRLVRAVAAHTLAPRHTSPAWIEQERGVVLGWAHCALQGDTQTLFHSTPRSRTSCTGSTANSGGASQCSRCPAPSRAYPRG